MQICEPNICSNELVPNILYNNIEENGDKDSEKVCI